MDSKIENKTTYLYITEELRERLRILGSQENRPLVDELRDMIENREKQLQKRAEAEGAA